MTASKLASYGLQLQLHSSCPAVLCVFPQAAAAAQADGEYMFAENNPFLGDPAAFEKGKDLFKRGLLSEAALALEAEVGPWGLTL